MGKDETASEHGGKGRDGAARVVGGEETEEGDLEVFVTGDVGGGGRSKDVRGIARVGGGGRSGVG